MRYAVSTDFKLDGPSSWDQFTRELQLNSNSNINTKHINRQTIADVVCSIISDEHNCRMTIISNVLVTRLIGLGNGPPAKKSV